MKRTFFNAKIPPWLYFLFWTTGKMVLLAAPQCHAADDDLRFRLKVSFSDQTVLFGDIYFATVQAEQLSAGTPVSKSIKNEIYGGFTEKRPMYSTEPVLRRTLPAEQNSCTVMLRATNLDRPKESFNFDPSHKMVDGIVWARIDKPLTPYEIEVTKSAILHNPQYIPDLNPPKIFSAVIMLKSLSWKRSYVAPPISIKPEMIEKKIVSTFNIPVSGFAFKVASMPEAIKHCEQLYGSYKIETAIMDGDHFPLDLTQWQPVLEKIDHRSNLAKLVADSRSYSALLDNKLLTDEQFLKLCVDLVKSTKPVTREWLAHAIETNLLETKPNLVSAYRNLMAQSQ